MKEKFEGKYVKLAITLFLTGAALIIFYSLVTNIKAISDGFNVIKSVLSPFIFGLVMAYLLCPIYNGLVRKTYSIVGHRWKNKKRALQLARVVGTVFSLLLLFGIVGGMFALVIPELIKSIIGIINTFPDRMNSAITWVQGLKLSGGNTQVATTIENLIETVSNKVQTWAQNEFLPKLGIYLGQISQGVIATLKTMLNLLIGVVVCVYFLNSKETFKAQTKKAIYALFNRETSEEIMNFANYTNITFGGFISGKIIDSIIMGILCFIVMNIIGLPYPILVSTIVGVTNFIPFFGPFIGAIPSAIIICLVSPLQALYFLIMVFILQQIDGNIIGPKILGESTGLASFWVMFAILVGGGFFGFVGMVLGVPMFAVIYYYVGRSISKRLKKKNMPSETWDYEDFNKYDIDRKDVQ